MGKRYLTITEVAEKLKKSKRTITRYIKKGLLNPERVKNEKGILEYKLKDYLELIKKGLK